MKFLRLIFYAPFSPFLNHPRLQEISAERFGAGIPYFLENCTEARLNSGVYLYGQSIS